MIWIILIVALVVVVGLIYNGLVSARNSVDQSSSDITVQLKRRYDLIPNLVSTVEGYASHEKDVLESVTKARVGAINAQGQGGSVSQNAENMLTSALKSLFAVSEAYPDLKANTNFLQLQEELVDAEDKIQAARRFYNSTLNNYADKLGMFPSNIVASLFGFKMGSYEYFEVENPSQVADPVKVDFNK